MIYLILTSKDDDTSYSLVVVENKNIHIENNYINNLYTNKLNTNNFSIKTDPTKPYSNCQCYRKKIIEITDQESKDKINNKQNEDCNLNVYEKEDQIKLLPQITNKFDLEKVNRNKQIHLKNFCIKFNSNQSILNLIIKGFLKATSRPWEMLLDLFTPQSNEGFLLILKFIIPLLFIWNFSEVELFILEKIMSRLKVSPSFLGLTIMSWGNNAPDMYNVASAMAKGLVDLALNAAIASEIHNILLGLGLPWLIYNLKYGKTIEFKMNNLYTSTFLFFCIFLVLLIAILKFNKYKFDVKLAFILIFFYFIFLILIFVLSFNIKIW